MSQVSLPQTWSWGESGRSRLNLLYRGMALKALEFVKDGEIRLIDGDMKRTFGVNDGVGSLTAEIVVRHPGFYKAMLFGGTLGAADAYVQGMWDCEQLTDLMRIVVRNRKVSDGLDKGMMKALKPVVRVGHWLKRNTIERSRKNIQAHYDIGNDLFEWMLDETMNYSSGIYASDATSLEEAQQAKMDRICRKLKLNENDHVIEIGTGWGGFAIHAAKHYGSRITTTTISERQYELAVQRVREAGLEDRITIVKEDYRKLRGQYDKLVSIEMIEAVGHEFLPTYFNQCASLLKPNGVMMIQAINMNEAEYERYLKSVDFIQRYVFPGSCCPSMGAIGRAVASGSDLSIVETRNIGPDYARTLADWRVNFHAKLEKVKGAGYLEAFVRLWDYYLSYCEAGFAERYITNHQIMLAKPGYRY